MNGILDIKPTIGGAPTNMQIGYFFMRIMLGMNLFFHGFMRIVTGVSAWAASLFDQSSRQLLSAAIAPVTDGIYFDD